MPRKKKKQQSPFDDFGDRTDEQGARSGGLPSEADAADPDAPRVSIEDFIIQEKIDAFLETYTPADVMTLQTEEFDDARLREYFKAYAFALGDPLKVYLRTLALHGFTMHTSLTTGQPVLLCLPKY